jgi:single-strand DNA-binding protein
MANFNKVFLMGNLTRDPEVSYTPKGTAVAKLGLAVNRQWTAENGEKKEEVTFVDVEAWGRQAETIGQYMSKGRPIFIEGRLKMDSWEDKETHQKRIKMKVVVENFQFLGAPGTKTEVRDTAPGEETAPRSRPAPRRPAAETPPPAEEPPVGDDNIPF